MLQAKIMSYLEPWTHRTTCPAGSYLLSPHHEYGSPCQIWTKAATKYNSPGWHSLVHGSLTLFWAKMLSRFKLRKPIKMLAWSMIALHQLATCGRRSAKQEFLLWPKYILKISSFVSSHFENPNVDFAENIRMKVIHTRSGFSIYNVIEFPCYSEILTCGNGVIILR